MGGLSWVTCHGPFKFESLGSCIPVPLGKIDNTDIDHFVARLPFSGHTFPGAVAEGCEGMYITNLEQSGGVTHWTHFLALVQIKRGETTKVAVRGIKDKA